MVIKFLFTMEYQKIMNIYMENIYLDIILAGVQSSAQRK